MPNTLPFVTSAEQFDAAFRALYDSGKPTFFDIDAPLPSAGRTDTPVAATPQMTVVVKCYAASGENALHAHTTEDHSFIVLQGHADFYGPRGECKTIGPLQGALLPHGTLYRFQAVGNEPLVMLRIGCAAVPGGSMHDRVNPDGSPVAGDSKENKQVPTVLSGKRFGPVCAA